MSKSENVKKLGTFAGVFTPSILTILGIILFMRLGYVVGNAGFYRSIFIIAIANIISILTSVSLSAIATNLKVKGGGDYYLISRTLGVEFGGAIGIVLFLAQSVSVAFYCIGFGEAVSLMAPDSTWFSPRIIAVIAVMFLFIFAWLGADWATRFQYVVMTFLSLAILSFFIGGIPQWESSTFIANWEAPPGALDFWPLFAIFFPAVTGFTQGVSMSGDLENPGKSLPLGTFFAVGLSILVYFAVAITFAGVLPNAILIQDYGAMKRVARFGILIDAGVISATLSSGMASFMGAPRILQSLASDQIFKFLQFFAKATDDSGNPRRAVILSGIIAFLTIGMGQLNLIAQVVSMFFLISYGLLNYATFYEARADSPSFRPRFRWFDKRLSLLGFLSCLGVMLAIDIKNGAIAIAILFGIYQYLKRTVGWTRWADGRRSYHLQQVREHLIAAANTPRHPRDWRPQLLVFTNDEDRRNQILQFAALIEGGSGLTTAVKVIEGSGVRAEKSRIEAEETLNRDLQKNNLKAFPLVISTSDIRNGLYLLSQAYGIGPLKANTMLFNWFDQLGIGLSGIEKVRFVQNLRALFLRGNNIVLLHVEKAHWEHLSDPNFEKSFIDVWWQDNETGRLTLMFAYLMTRNRVWEDTEIRLILVKTENGEDLHGEEIRNMMDDFRIKVTPVMAEDMSVESVADVSQNSAFVFLPFRIHNHQIVEMSGYSYTRILNRLPAVALVMAAEDIDLAAEPEEGEAGEVAALLDAFEMAQKRVDAAQKEADAFASEVETLEKEMEKLKTEGAEAEQPANLKTVITKLEKVKVQTEELNRKFEREKAKAKDAEDKIDALGLLDFNKDDA